MKKYSMLLNMDEELKHKLEQIAKKLHTTKSQAIRYLILNYDKDWYLLQGYFHNEYQKPLGDTNSDSKFHI